MAACLGLAAISYPIWLVLFHASVTQSIPMRLAPLWLGFAFAVPLVGLGFALRLSSANLASHTRVRSLRRFAYGVIAAPTLFTFLGVLNYMAGMPLPDLALWSVLWGALLILVLIAAEEEKRTPWPHLARWRVAHGISGAILAMFVAFHLTNHLTGLIGPAAHKSVMAAGRTVYRSILVEPLLVAAFIFQVVTGLRLAWHWSAERANRFRVFQIATGFYLSLFILGHMNSVFIYARSFMKIDTDWMFAIGGPAGIISDAWNIRLLPHYWFGAFFVLSHLAAGLRIVMLSHGVPAAAANRLLLGGVAASFTVSTAILLGMCGLRV